jgi:ribosomal protein L32
MTQDELYDAWLYECPNCGQQKWPNNCVKENCPMPPRETLFDSPSSHAAKEQS